MRWNYEGHIEFLGRVDTQVKVRGFRIELGEIESRLLSFPGVKEALVLAREYKSGDRYLCAYVVAIPKEHEARRGKEAGMPTAVELRKHLSQSLPGYMVPAYYTFLEKMPLTPNGKIDQKALPEPEARAAGVYVVPRDEVEKRMTAIWSAVLGIEEEKIGIDDNFFELGGHSLKATKLVYFIRKEFEVNMDLKDVFANSCIRELAQIIKAAEEQQYVAIRAVEEKEYYNLSYAQRRLWVLCQFEEDSTAYNMPGAIVFSGLFNAAAFSKAIQTLADRHESLRTVFISVAGDPFQRVIKNLKVNLGQIDLRQLEEEEKDKKARQIYLDDANSPIDLERGPLFRFKLVRLEEEKNLLIHNFHHIINDGWSQGNIYNEIITLYNTYRANKDNPFPPLGLQYKDYTRWHNNLISSGIFDESRNYWMEKFKDKPNGIELPIDHPRKPLQTFNGGRISFTIAGEKTGQLSRFSADEDVTFFMGLLALVAILLYKYSGQEDILIGAPIANRRQPELHPVVGFLVNTLIFRTRVKPGLSFRQFLNHTKKETLECYENQDYPFDLLVEQLGLDRDLSQSPLFNFMLAHNNAETEENVQAMEGLETSPYAFEVDYNMSKFDLIFHLNEFADSLHPVIEYNSDLFERSTIERMVDNFLTLTDNIIAHPDAPISNLNIISEAEYETIIHRFNDSSCPFPQLTIREMFENQVEKSADKYAVIYHEDKITYKDLNMEANRLAHYLGNTYHVQPNDIIAISMERSIDMIVVLLGILKSGAAYLALDPSYPKDRVHHVLENSRTDLLITDKKRPELFADYSGTIIDITTCIEAVSRESTGNPEIRNRLSDILYVNYTSGSTGMPNGAMLSQDCLSNLIYWQSEKTTIDCSLRCLQFTSINFCVSFQEIMGTLTSGGELYLIGDVERQDIDYLLDFLSKYQVEILFLPFSYLNFLFNESTRWDQSFNHNLKHIITAGEQLKVTSGLKRFLDLNPDLQLHNHYGSTEMHVVTSYTLDASSAEQTPIPPAGKPIGNVKIYILDEHLKPVPMGVWGELFVAGRSEIPGYINNDELNREKLVLHPELSENNQRLYRSGDSGRWLEDGNIELRGRKDFLVKIRGFRVELGEIESKLLALEQVRECVVVDREDAAGQKCLVAYVVKDNIDIGEINRILNNDLPLYMIPQVVFLEKLPLMPNGKVDREKLPEPEMALDKEYKAPGNELEKKLVEIWSDILGLEKERISVDANFFGLGGHSLRATTLVSRIHKEFDVKVPLVEIFRFPTVSEISSFIKSLETETFTGIEAVKEKEYYALSSAQKRLYVQQHMQLDSKIYNLPSVMRLVGKLKKEWLEEVFGKLIRRHESLRTSFPQVDGEPVQKIHRPEEIEFGIEYFSGEQERRREPCVPPPLCSYDDIIDRFIRPFDLSKPPLLRVGLIKTGEEEHIFLVDMHHIVTDGTSMGILVREFMALYSGEELPPLTIRYKDFSEWQNRMFQSADFKKQEAYWLKQFAGPLPVLDLPGDFPENQPDDSGGGYVFFEIEPHMTAEIRKLVSETGTTLFILLLAIYTVLLSKYTGKEDIVVGTGIAGRRHADLDNVLGLFINMLALRNRPEKGKTFFKFLEEVKQAAFDGYANQDYQYEELVRSLDLQGNAAGSPLFETIFQVQNMEIPELKIPGLELKPYDYEFRISRHPLIIYATEAGDKINMMLLYSTRVFLHETAEKLAERFLEVVEQVVMNREIKLQDIILSFDLEKLETPVLQEEQGDFEF
ncbi:MAG: amino acid adenylation domain-containing protein [Candidatus Aminicenantes bacterium]|nr:amino acid adenylation domain-containing protein [Candidatus Aminicenantes bacterium]